MSAYQFHLAVDDVKSLLLAVMDVRGQAAAGWSDDLDQRKSAMRLLAVEEHAMDNSEDVQRGDAFGVGGDGMQRHAGIAWEGCSLFPEKLPQIRDAFGRDLVAGGFDLAPDRGGAGDDLDV